MQPLYQTREEAVIRGRLFLLGLGLPGLRLLLGDLLARLRRLIHQCGGGNLGL